ncbi:NAD(+) synthase [Marichromatium gracile]|uniref:NH(3)-dependent NAD(+) synthetase n=1 Tax=Marichromatium gracile TaxID=1048 RepID=A0A4R4A6W7_MARGR|nr:NAD(+) synthase [Marichromatium gracile]TCW34573.1 NAD+ synthase [Marichromatium gracile]
MEALLNTEDISRELVRIIDGLRRELDGASAVIGLSGGLDSDVVARLAVSAVGAARVKLFTVFQEGMEDQHIRQARQTAEDLEIPLRTVDLGEIPRRFVEAMAAADPDEAFRPDGLLDPARAKCSLRTAILSTYQDRGYVVIGTSNRTEIETGFFLPFGDGIWHFGPIAHLYKTEVVSLAHLVGTRQEVILQPPSAGFWLGQEDLEDLAYWLLNGGPIGRQRIFTDEDDAQVQDIRTQLTLEKIDRTLLAFSKGRSDSEASAESALPLGLVARLRQVCEGAGRSKRRPMGRRLDLPR